MKKKKENRNQNNLVKHPNVHLKIPDIESNAFIQ